MEEEDGEDLAEARRLFGKATEADPRMTHAWQAWGMLELRQGDFSQARRLFQSAVWATPANSDACVVWQVPPPHPPTQHPPTGVFGRRKLFSAPPPPPHHGIIIFPNPSHRRTE